MANVLLLPGTNVDLYAATGITPGVKLKVSSNYARFIRLSVSESGLLDDFVTLYEYKQAENEAGDAGAWALSTLERAVINVREA